MHTMMLSHDRDSGIFDDTPHFRQSISSDGSSHFSDDLVSLHNASSYKNSFRPILKPNDLLHVGARCRQSVIDTDDHYLSPTRSCSQCDSPRSNNSTLIQHPSDIIYVNKRQFSASTRNKTDQSLSSSPTVLGKCHLLRSCLSSKTISHAPSPRKRCPPPKPQNQFFIQLARHRPLLLVLNGYHCNCGCGFSVQNGDTVICLDATIENKWITVISRHMICSKMPQSYVCDVYALRQNVKARPQQCSMIETEF
ncbi:unnamed protein product [Didymodactylos carnosus]|uniref:Uncharacterized protein n=1 Tax=Didymodactylos carnosus TaxID=1234261 RepID=A0A814EXE4_9BILA|nr:unnamed protein product [Didymodactylos carnosus]CAF0975140.1 unnamed protein product [Didymodactylos carnosus]CAF3576522.1 unnamed protein product [Didymodactylos carnosus]CAF3747973.1 unnamed protein product [Didymodactylos carnosus]